MLCFETCLFNQKRDLYNVKKKYTPKMLVCSKTLFKRTCECALSNMFSIQQCVDSSFNAQ
ncbi:hypothetical protein AB205_0172020 [Aquarana catesbeiana]|uniref:Uncharacterized protein n=1 Tax=Aquarana catesbeiana TaxID=8400 RepID=A0A2G9S646_AQUCT|nr:hypothetical protein AB205_0172020 [Aquarana catesbeiana]